MGTASALTFHFSAGATFCPLWKKTLAGIISATRYPLRPDNLSDIHSGSDSVLSKELIGMVQCWSGSRYTADLTV